MRTTNSSIFLTGGRNAFAIAAKLPRKTGSGHVYITEKKGAAYHNQKRWGVNEWANTATGDHRSENHTDGAYKSNEGC